ncbi:hypothetical protein HPDFL43_09422 [Hoeflea phototrophica DFL-43]|jgi:hypothetical protein|uniref:Uncharacterized protein n=1 Tax=Hoeflea phototrophica (strain DSM 17068 / NCIMB 14078 / DFL-43) TaxID=411684 RepID=A9D689_HOEPD|nr:hypothetical protein [Hoeflea phototrophica]EDQ33445.1 hypothetical protein HPDFL43_09422 [Hoeflea phototrophica DFL-43]
MKSPVRKHKGPKPRPANDNSNLRDRLHAARIGWRETLLGAIGWGAAMALSAQASLWLSNAALTSHYWNLTALTFAGAALAWPLSLSAFRFLAFGRGREPAFAAAVLCLIVFTIGITAVLFAIIYRNFYAQWHGDPFTKLWLIQLAFTSASALYQFAVVGLRLYLPLGVVLLFAAAVLLARGHRRQKPVKTTIPH